MTRFFLTWAGAFATVFLIFEVFGAELADWPLWMRALVVSGLMVAAMQHVMGPGIAWVLRRLDRI